MSTETTRRATPVARVARTAGVVVVVLALGSVGWSWWASRLPASYSAAAMGTPDFGGGAASGHEHGHGGPGVAATSVVDLVADASRPADVRVEVAARFDGERYTLNGTTPGPTIRARQGQLLEVHLTNVDVPDGVTLHWHGMEVPNAMDGVAGVTQDAVGPGASFTYRFVVDRAGTFWYHSHQVSHVQVVRGLFGAIVVDPAAGEPLSSGAAAPAASDAVVLLHTYPGESRTLNGRPGESRHDARPGEVVRVRIANTDNAPTVAWVAGAPFPGCESR